MYMEALLIYIAKSATVLTLFALLFSTLLQHETFHRFKRFTLLLSILLAFVIPLVNIGVETPLTALFAQETPTNTEVNITPQQLTITANSAPPTTLPDYTLWDYTTLLAAIYLTGVTLLFIRLIIMYISIARIIKRGEKQEKAPYTTHRVELRIINEEIKPFSWFRWVVINNSDLQECGREIIIHESAHCHALHSLDIAIAEIVIILQWFNPFAWFVKKQLKEIHEYEADQAVLHSGINIEKYQQLIIKKAVGARLYSIANSFNHSSTIKRITMMCKKKSNLWRCTKALYILPATAIAALLFSQPESINATEPENNGKVTEFTANNQKTRLAIAAGDSTVKKNEVSAIGKVKNTQPNATVRSNDPVFQVVEKMPQFPGGEAALMQFLQNSIRYPAEARSANAQGRCFVQFIVNSNGKINNAEIVKSSGNEALDKEALRVVNSMPVWNPGTQGGERVNTRLTLPIAFKTSKPADTTPEGPLLIINGAIYEGDAAILTAFNEEHIESINVLQKEEATKIHGERGRHGAIMIKLKENAINPVGIFLIGLADSLAKAEKAPKMYQFNVGLAQDEKAAESYDAPAQFNGDTNILQLDNTTSVLESGLTEGSVTLEFNIETDGSITSVKVKKSSGNPRIDAEAGERLYHTQRQWSPATKDGKPVRTRPSITLTFSKHK